MKRKLTTYTAFIVKHPLFSGSALMVGGSLGANAINYVYHLLMGRILGPVDYGILASVYSILYIVSVIPTSTNFAVVKFISAAKTNEERSDFFHTVKKLFFFVALVSGLAMLLFAPFVAKFLHIDNLMVILLIGPVLFFWLLILVNAATLQGLLKFIGVVAPNFVSSLGKLIFGLILVFMGFSVSGAVGAVLIASVFAYLLSEFMVRKEITDGIKNKVNLKPFLKYSFPVLLQALAFTAFFTVDLILVKHFLPPFEAGLYAALSTLGKIIFFAAQPVTSVMFPLVAGKKSKGEKYSGIFYIALLITLAMSFGIAGFYYLFPKLTIGMLYGSEYLAAQDGLVWMGLFIATYTASYMLINFLLSIGKTRIVILPLLIAVIQVLAIVNWHNSIVQVIQISFLSMVVLFAGSISYLVYLQARRVNAR